MKQILFRYLFFHFSQILVYSEVNNRTKFPMSHKKVRKHFRGKICHWTTELWQAIEKKDRFHIM